MKKKHPTPRLPPLAELGPLKIVPFRYSGASRRHLLRFRVTGRIFKRQVQKTLPTLEAAHATMAEIYRAAFGNITPDKQARCNFVRTWLTQDQVLIAETLFLRQEGQPWNLPETQAAGLHALQARETVRSDPRGFLVASLRELGYAQPPVRKPGETEAAFSDRAARATDEAKMLEQADEATLALAHYILFHSKRGLQPNTVAVYGYVIGLFLRTQKIKTLEEITAAKILAFVSREDVEPRTRKDHRTRLAEFCKHLLNERLLRDNPAQKIGRIKVPAKPIEFVPVAVMRQALEDFSRRLHRRQATEPRATALAPLLLYAFCGARPDAIARLAPDWSNFNFERGTVQLVRGKTGSENATIPLHPDLVPLLRRLRDQGIAPCQRSPQRWLRWLTEAGVKPRVRDILRHTYATYDFSIHHNYHDLAFRMDNSVEVLRKHYVNTSATKADGEAYFGLLREVPEFLEAAPYAPDWEPATPRG